MGIGEAMVVPPPPVDVDGRGSKLAQIVAVGELAGWYSTLRCIPFLLFGFWGKIRERTNAKMYHSRRVDRSHRLRKKDISLPRKSRNHEARFIPVGVARTVPVWRTVEETRSGADASPSHW